MSHPTQCYFCLSLRVQLFILFYFQNQNPKKKIRKNPMGSGRSQELIEKATCLKKKGRHQNFCSWSQNWFYATFFRVYFGVLVYRLSLILVRWVGAGAFKLSLDRNPDTTIQWFSSHTLLWCCRAKDLSNVGERRGPSTGCPAPGLLAHVWAFLYVCCSAAHSLVCVKSKQKRWIFTLVGSCWTMW